MKTDNEKDYEEAYLQSWSQFSTWQAKAKDDIRAYLGDSYTDAEKQKMLIQGRDRIDVQLIRRIIKWVSGWQRDKRKSAKFDPIEGSDDQAASDFTAIDRWSMVRNDGYNEISDGFEHALKTGMCLINQYNDQNYNTKLDRFFYNQFLLDPSFTKLNLEDCYFGILRRYITKEQAKLILPIGSDRDIDKIDDERTSFDKFFPNYSVPHLYGKKLLPYDEFQRRITEKRKYIIIKPLGIEMPVAEGSSETDLRRSIVLLKERVGLTSDQITVVTKHVPTVRVTSFLNGKEMVDSVDPFGLGDFSFTPIIGYYDPEYDEMCMKLQGLVRCLVDPQRAENRRVAAMLFHFESTMQAGLDFEEDALVDPEDAFRSGPGQSRMFKSGAISNRKYQDRVIPEMPQGYVAIHQILNEMMPKMVNLNEEAFGQPSSNSQVSTVVQQMRVEGSLIGQKGLFDNLTLSQKIMAQKRLKLYQQYPVQRVQRILNRQPSGEFYTKKFGEFDVTMQESLMTTTQRNAFYSELLYLKQQGMAMGDPAPISWDLILRNSPIEMKKELFDDIERQQKIAHQSQQKQQAVAEQIQQLNIANAQSQIVENQTQALERRTAARENLANAGLDRVKMINEMNDSRQSTEIENAIKLEELQIEREKLALERQKMSIMERGS